jgi:hypothetical protein
VPHSIVKELQNIMRLPRLFLLALMAAVWPVPLRLRDVGSVRNYSY